MGRKKQNSKPYEIVVDDYFADQTDEVIDSLEMVGAAVDVADTDAMEILADFPANLLEKVLNVEGVSKVVRLADKTTLGIGRKTYLATAKTAKDLKAVEKAIEALPWYVYGNIDDVDKTKHTLTLKIPPTRLPEIQALPGVASCEKSDDDEADEDEEE